MNTGTVSIVVVLSIKVPKPGRIASDGVAGVRTVLSRMPDIGLSSYRKLRRVEEEEI